jgi:hypothetical protein
MNLVRWSALAIAASLGTACALIVGVTDLGGSAGTDASTGDARLDAIADGGTVGDGGSDARPDVGTGRSTCPYAQLSCDGGVIDPLTDKDNCGTCGTRCDTGARQTCVVGYCLRPFYIGPDGIDQATNGTAADASVKTFAYAVAHFDVGQALVLLPGTYSNADGGSGIINVTCGMSAQNGMGDQPIVVAAQEERGAIIQSDGTQSAVSINDCSNWVVYGMTTEIAQLYVDGGAPPHTVAVNDGENVELLRMLVDGNNRLYTSSNPGTYAIPVVLHDVTGTRLIESEIYDFDTVGLAVSGSDVEVQRVYVNPRDAAAPIVDTTPPSVSYGGGGRVLFENVVSDNSPVGQGVYFDNYGPASFLGSLIMGGSIGMDMFADEAFVVRDLVVVGTTGNGLRVYAMPLPGSDGGALAPSLSVSNVSLFGTGGANFASPGSTNLVATNIESAFGHGIGITATHPWIVKDCNSSSYFGDSGVNEDFSAPLDSGLFEQCTRTQPTHFGIMGPDECVAYVWPDGGPIGANLIYRYEDGGLTTTPLWSCNGFPCGAVVPGINDYGDTCRNVAARLNFEGGCPFP